MGNDGGSIPTRRELVKEAARSKTTTQVKETQQEQQSWDWTTCPLSHMPLSQPVVSDCAGKLYNKDAILEFLLPSDDSAKKAESTEYLNGRVKSLRDIIEVKFEVETESKDGTTTRAGDIWVCPITRKRLGPGLKSVYLVPCGHAYSEIAIKEVSSDTCLQCNENYTPDNVIPILSISNSECDRLIKRAEDLRERGLTHSLKKLSGSGKKRKKPTTGDAPNAITVNDSEDVKTSAALEPNVSAPSKNTSAISATIKNANTASLTSKVLKDEEERSKRRKRAMNDNLKGLFSNGATSKEGKSGDFMTRGYSIPASTRR
ncbi:MAG: hypothetical protein M1825_000728 [Sarcosagium campestre]|nr:MAG: hypothetical protein M1825_000728 [Sarcosagium campestre]